MSKLAPLQKALTNDLRAFQDHFLKGLGGSPEGDESKNEPAGSEAPYRVPTLDIFDTWAICGIVGGRRPSTYSESPKMWNRYFREIDRKGVFFAFDLPPESNFLEFMDNALNVPGFVDLTVTDPYKQPAFRFLPDVDFQLNLSDQAAYTRAVNHIILDAEKKTLLVLNTDGMGMIRAIREKKEIKDKKVLIIGAGGSAVSIGYELVKAGSDLLIVNRTAARAEALKADLGGAKTAGQKLDWGDLDRLPDYLEQSDIVISTVPEGCPLGVRHIKFMKEGVLLAETTYGRKSALKDMVVGTGLDYVDGRAMLFGQFVEAVDQVYPLLGISGETHRKAIQTMLGDR
jgi:shikimate 5-dehydrogenase